MAMKHLEHYALLIASSFETVRGRVKSWLHLFTIIIITSTVTSPPLSNYKLAHAETHENLSLIYKISPKNGRGVMHVNIAIV